MFYVDLTNPSNSAQVSEDGHLRKAFWGLRGDVSQKKWHPSQAKRESHWAKVLISHVLFRLWTDFEREHVSNVRPVES